MLKKQASVETWQKRPTSSVPRPSRLPYGPTPGGSSNRSSRLGPSQLITQRPSEDNTQLYIPSHNKATFQWVRGELLGQGSYGRVYMALNVNTGELMAVKQVDFPREDHKFAQRDALRFLAFESETLKELEHPNIVQYLGYQDSSEALSVFLEYVPGGTVGSLIQKYGRFREEVTKSFTKQILEGLDYLHNCGIIHRDLKPDNILVEPTGVCKISDFGISKRVEDINSARGYTLMRGTVQYMAPEVLGDRGYNGKIDIWSVGCMVMEMWTGEKPWGANANFMDILTLMVKLRDTQSTPPLPTQLQKELSSNARNLRESCFHVNPVHRPSAAQLKQHPYLGISPGWSFSENEIAHPSQERRTRRQRDHEDGEFTLRPNGRASESQEATIQPGNFAKDDGTTTFKPTNQPAPRGSSPPIVYIQPETFAKEDGTTTSGAINQPVPRGPSPPIVYIQPLAHNPSPVRPPSLTDTQDQDNATSESSATSNSRRSKNRKIKYHVVNHDAEPSPSLQYVPPPLPPITQRYSAHLGTSSKYNLDYIPDPTPNSRSRSSSSPHIASTPAPSSSSSGRPLASYSSSKSSSSSNSSLAQSSGTDDSATRKRPPVPEPLRRGGASPSSVNARHEHGGTPTGYSGAHLRTPPPPTVPPPLPPARTLRFAPSMPLMRAPTRPSSSSKRKQIQSQDSNQVVDRPFADDIVRHLGDYFPNHDLDQPVVLPAFAEDVGQGISLNLNDDGVSDLSAVGHRPAPVVSDIYGHANNSANPSRLSRLGSLALRPFSSRLGGASSNLRPPLDESGVGALVLSGSVSNDGDRLRNGQGGLGHAKSIRRIAEEQASKRQSNPGRAHRQTLWGIQMEELEALPQRPSSALQQRRDSRRL